MIEFKKGEFFRGEFPEIFKRNKDDILPISWFECELKSSCWVLEIPNDCSDRIWLYNAHEKGLFFVPREEEEYDDDYHIFWESYYTVIFSSIEQALKHVGEYKGFREEELKELTEDIKHDVEIKKLGEETSLEEKLAFAVEREYYERAAKIRDEILKREKKGMFDKVQEWYCDVKDVPNKCDDELFEKLQKFMFDNTVNLEIDIATIKAFLLHVLRCEVDDDDD